MKEKEASAGERRRGGVCTHEQTFSELDLGLAATLLVPSLTLILTGSWEFLTFRVAECQLFAWRNHLSAFTPMKGAHIFLIWSLFYTDVSTGSVTFCNSMSFQVSNQIFGYQKTQNSVSHWDKGVPDKNGNRLCKLTHSSGKYGWIISTVYPARKRLGDR